MTDRPLSPRRGTQRSERTRRSLPYWPCLMQSAAVAVTPLRNLTSDPARQFLVDDFTDRLVAELFRRCRGFSFVWLSDEPRWVANLAPPNPPELKYIVSGSVQRGDPRGMLRANVRISDAVTADYLWAGRQEFRPEYLAPIHTDIARQISRALNTLLLHEASRRAALTSNAELGVNERLARGEATLKGELRADLGAQAQQWFLAALAYDPRNVNALIGVAATCQFLVSNPWWTDPRGAAAAADLGREAVSIALELAPTHARAKTFQGMLYSAAGQLEEAASAFRQALTMDEGLASAHAFGGYNTALLGRAWETVQAVERAMHLNSTHSRYSTLCFFGGFAELLLGRTHEAIVLLQKSLERNPTYGSAQLFLMAALSLTGRHSEAVSMAKTFRQQYPVSPAQAFEQLWLSRSTSPVYRAQVYPLYEKIRGLGATNY
jgi:tetratricopeptide (TPR) repeat protein